MENISYAINSKINNTYGINGTNYNPEIGNINGGQDYEATERNIYNLYIPKSAMDKKDKYNGIFIYLHGGTRFKEDMDYFCSRYAKMGYIAATVDYNEITTNSQNTNFFRYLDELTVAISDIKQKLKENGFNENKLELALGGHSLGGHLSMLYGYSMQNKRNKSPIPIKFIINQAGSLDIDQEYAYKVAIFNKTLANIEPDTINEAIKNGTLIPSVTGSYILKRYNSYLDNGNRYSESQIKEMLDDNENIKYDSELYQNFSKITKYFYGSYYINETAKKNEHIIPVLFEVAGNDANMGIAQYKLVKLLSEKYNFTLDLVYMRYANHSLLYYETPHGIEAYRDFHEKILKFAELYFKSPDYDMEKLEKQVADAGRYESWNILYGIKLENLSYATNGTIINTYGINGENYNPEILMMEKIMKKMIKMYIIYIFQ